MKKSTFFIGFITKPLMILIFLFNIQSLSAQQGGALFQAGPTMMRGKIFPTATLLDNGNVITFSGRETNFVSCLYSDMYNATNNTFTENAMNFPHDGSATVRLSDGRFFLLGGSMDLGVAPGYATTEMYNQTTSTFEIKASMTMSRMQHGAVQLANGKVLVVGAWYNTSGATYGEIYDTASNSFTATGALNDPRSQPFVFPTNDGGAIITGGWPSYGGAVKTTVEYYQTTTNDFITQSSELIPADPGWLPLAIYTRPFADFKMSNGKYMMMAYRTSPVTEYALIEFDPATKLFSKFNTSSPLIDSLTDGGFADFVLNNNDNIAYLVGFDSGYDPQRVSLVAVDLSNGNIYHPTTTFTLPAQEYFYAAYTYMPSVEKILVQGVNSGNTSYFTGTNKTYLLTPQMIPSGINNINSEGNESILCYPNPAQDAFTIEFEATSNTRYTLKLIDMFGRIIYLENKEVAQTGSHQWIVNSSNIPTGLYKLLLSTSNQVKSKSILITK